MYSIENNLENVHWRRAPDVRERNSEQCESELPRKLAMFSNNVASIFFTSSLLGNVLSKDFRSKKSARFFGFGSAFDTGGSLENY